MQVGSLALDSALSHGLFSVSTWELEGPKIYLDPPPPTAGVPPEAPPQIHRVPEFSVIEREGVRGPNCQWLARLPVEQERWAACVVLHQPSGVQDPLFPQKGTS